MQFEDGHPEACGPFQMEWPSYLYFLQSTQVGYFCQHCWLVLGPRAPSINLTKSKDSLLFSFVERFQLLWYHWSFWSRRLTWCQLMNFGSSYVKLSSAAVQRRRATATATCKQLTHDMGIWWQLTQQINDNWPAQAKLDFFSQIQWSNTKNRTDPTFACADVPLRNYSLTFLHLRLDPLVLERCTQYLLHLRHLVLFFISHLYMEIYNQKILKPRAKEFPLWRLRSQPICVQCVGDCRQCCPLPWKYVLIQGTSVVPLYLLLVFPAPS